MQIKELNLQLVPSVCWDGPEIKAWLQAGAAELDVQIMPPGMQSPQLPTLTIYPSLQTALISAVRQNVSLDEATVQWCATVAPIVTASAQKASDVPHLLIASDAPETQAQGIAKALSDVFSIKVELPALSCPEPYHPIAEAVAVLLRARDREVAQCQQELSAGGVDTASIGRWGTLWDETRALEVLAEALETNGALHRQRLWHEALRQSLWRAEHRTAQVSAELQHYKSELSLVPQEIAARDAHIQSLLTSTSWRVTRPLRTMRTILRRFLRH